MKTIRYLYQHWQQIAISIATITYVVLVLRVLFSGRFAGEITAITLFSLTVGLVEMPKENMMQHQWQRLGILFFALYLVLGHTLWP
jgi:hypothetical protein